jgi:hypothetical protein
VNTPTAIGTYVFGVVVVVLIGLVIRLMLRGWKHRTQRQAEAIGELPDMPDVPGPTVVGPSTGMYVGSTIAESEALPTSGSSADWLNRVTVGDLGYRSRALLTRYRHGILLERSGMGRIWIPQDSVVGVRTERGLAGKVLPAPRTGSSAAGILVMRWRLPSGTVIDTGFRGDDRRDYAQWLGEEE